MKMERRWEIFEQKMEMWEERIESRTCERSGRVVGQRSGEMEGLER